MHGHVEIVKSMSRSNRYFKQLSHYSARDDKHLGVNQDVEHYKKIWIERDRVLKKHLSQGITNDDESHEGLKQVG